MILEDRKENCFKKKIMKEQLNNRFSGQNVVITGGSSGIGLEMARRFVLMNAQVHLIARNPEKTAASRGRVARGSRVGEGVAVRCF